MNSHQQQPISTFKTILLEKLQATKTAVQNKKTQHPQIDIEAMTAQIDTYIKAITDISASSALWQPENPDNFLLNWALDEIEDKNRITKNESNNKESETSHTSNAFNQVLEDSQFVSQMNLPILATLVAAVCEFSNINPAQQEKEKIVEFIKNETAELTKAGYTDAINNDNLTNTYIYRKLVSEEIINVTEDTSNAKNEKIEQWKIVHLNNHAKEKNDEKTKQAQNNYVKERITLTPENLDKQTALTEAIQMGMYLPHCALLQNIKDDAMGKMKCERQNIAARFLQEIKQCLNKDFSAPHKGFLFKDNAYEKQREALIEIKNELEKMVTENNSITLKPSPYRNAKILEKAINTWIISSYNNDQQALCKALQRGILKFLGFNDTQINMHCKQTRFAITANIIKWMAQQHIYIASTSELIKWADLSQNGSIKSHQRRANNDYMAFIR